MLKRTKIVCTIGPASHSAEVLADMIRAGMNMARLNFSHGTYADHASLISLVRSRARACGEPIGILADLQGPRLRLGVLPEAGIEAKDGDSIVFDTRAKSARSRPRAVPIVFPELARYIKKGHRILFDDGQIEAVVERVIGSQVYVRITHGGTLKSHKGINTPDTLLPVASLTAKDKKDAAFLISQGVEWIGFSFVQNARDIHELRALIQKCAPKKQPAHTLPKILAKIERKEAVRNIEEIIRAADGIMIARGDLGLEMPAEEVPLIQKRIIGLCLPSAKPVVVATQMLDSMIRNPRPTRAEVSDVANAVIDHTDAVMLSGETASGAFPVQSVKMMARICARTERSRLDDVPPAESFASGVDAKQSGAALIKLACILAEDIKVKAIVASSLTGHTCRQLSSVRTEVPLYVATDTEQVCRQLNLSWGAHPFVIQKCASPEELARCMLAYLTSNKILKKGNRIVLLAGSSVGKSGGITSMELETIS